MSWPLSYWTPTVWNVRADTDRRLPELDDAQAINNRGWVAGTALYRETSRASRPLVWRPSGSLIELPFMPGDDSTVVTGINDRGQVVGTSMNVDVGGRTVRRAGRVDVRRRTICALARPGDLDTTFAINDRGRIVGGYLTLMECLFVKWAWRSGTRDGFLGAAAWAGSDLAGWRVLATHGQTLMRGLATA